MNRSIAILTVTSVMALVASCAPDAYLGTYAYSESNTFTITGPMMLPTMNGTASGTLDIVAGTGADYRITIHAPPNSGGGDCALQANRGGTGITFASGQTCAVSGNGATGTATLTSGTGSVSGNALTLNLSYSIAGMSPQGSFTATTVDADTATRQ